MVMALYIGIMYATQSFAFGQYQVRIATALYSVAYLFPFLVLPLGLANALSNLLMGGLGFMDIAGGAIVGLLTSGCAAAIGRCQGSVWLTAIPIALIPALGASAWLAYLLNMPYWALAASLLVGQAICGAAGASLANALSRIFRKNAAKEKSHEK